MNQRTFGWQFAVSLALVTVGVTTRLALRDIPNFAPVAALALFAGYLLTNRRLAVAVPLAVMAASDLVIGGYDLRLMAVVYAMLAWPAVGGGWLRQRLAGRRGWSASGAVATLVGSSLAASIVFFAVTNLAVWALGSMYPHTLDGLLQCYARAIPFFRYTLAGDLLFSVVLFGGYALVQWGLRSSQTVAESPVGDVR
ncbi:MAG: DUF6580 family putative transport protein [Pirellulales bacterium]